MPLTLPDDARFTGANFNDGSGVRFSSYSQPSPYDIQNLIAIRMNLAFMWRQRVSSNGYNSYRHSIDPLRWTWLANAGRNRKITMNMQGQLISVFLPDDQQQIVGGACGWTAFGWLHIDVQWLKEDIGRKGLGRQVLEATEAETTKRGCKFAEAETFSFQALGFLSKEWLHRLRCARSGCRRASLILFEEEVGLANKLRGRLGRLARELCCIQREPTTDKVQGVLPWKIFTFFTPSLLQLKRITQCLVPKPTPVNAIQWWYSRRTDLVGRLPKNRKIV